MDLKSVCLSQFSRLRESLADWNTALDAMSAEGSVSLTDLSSSLPPRGSAELHFAVTYAVIALYEAQLRCQETDVAKHAVRREVERLEAYRAKLSMRGEKRKAVVDVEAASRIIQHYTAAPKQTE